MSLKAVLWNIWRKSSFVVALWDGNQSKIRESETALKHSRCLQVLITFLSPVVAELLIPLKTALTCDRSEAQRIVRQLLFFARSSYLQYTFSCALFWHNRRVAGIFTVPAFPSSPEDYLNERFVRVLCWKLGLVNNTRFLCFHTRKSHQMSMQWCELPSRDGCAQIWRFQSDLNSCSCSPVKNP